MLANLVQETANNPGTGMDVLLGGAPAGRRPFAIFGNGATPYYFITDGIQSEWGRGTLTTGSPNKLSRTTVVGNTAGNTARLNFSGAVILYNDVPAELMPLLDAGGLLSTSVMPQALICQLGSTVARSIPHATGTTFNFDTLGANSLGGASGPAGSYNGVVLPTGGAYSVEANVVFASNGVGIRNLSLVINNTFPLAIDQKVAAGLGQVSLRGTWTGGLNAGDTLTVQVSQDSGGALSAGGGLTTNMVVRRL